MRRLRQRLRHVETLEPRRLLAITAVQPLEDLAVPADSAPVVIDLAGRFDDPSVTGTVVRFDLNQPAPQNRVFVELFDAAGPGRTRTTPLTVANFLQYVDSGRYQNTFIHRSVPGFVVQGGGYTVTGGDNPEFDGVPAFPAVVNEPGNTNARGTIAMAKLPAEVPGGGPNSATNQFFFSLANNAAILDGQNGGFTAFGRVLGAGMSVIDGLAAVPRFGFDSPFNEIPLRDVPGAKTNVVNDPALVETLATGQFLAFPQIVRVGELVYSVTSSAPQVVAASIGGDGKLSLSFAPGTNATTSVTVRATSVFDPTIVLDESFLVTLGDPPPPINAAIIGLTGNEVVIARSTGAALDTRTVVTPPSGIASSSTTAGTWDPMGTVVGDFNGDGRDDVTSQAADGTWWMSLLPATGTATPTAWGTLPAAAWQFATAGDFTGDGLDDVAVRNATNGAWRVLTSTGSSFTSARWGGWATGIDWQHVKAGDFNGDGLTDLVGQRPADGTWWVARSTGTAFVTEQWHALPTGVTWQFGIVGDYDGDGRDDIAIRNAANGAWRVLSGSASGFVSGRWGTWGTDSGWSRVKAGDFDGDGRDDLVGQRLADATWWVARSSGTAFTSSQWHALPPGVTWQFGVVGDFDGDGRDDYAIRNATNGAWRVLVSTGSAFTSSRWGTWETSRPWARAFAARG